MDITVDAVHGLAIEDTYTLANIVFSCNSPSGADVVIQVLLKQMALHQKYYTTKANVYVIQD